jgi:hypothetical protein
MADLLNTLKQYGSSLGTNLVRGAIPGIASGLITEMFHQWRVDTAMVTRLVQNNQSLWDGLKPETRAQLGDLAEKVGSLDFITPQFLILSIRRDFPAVASLFLNWPEAADWLERQIKELKAGLGSTEQSQ